jgi:hypothetical protein
MSVSVGAWAITAQDAGLALCAVVALTAGALMARGYFRARPSPEEIERQRRLNLHAEGKLGDGEIIDVDPQTSCITYSYSIAGVGYTAAQDVSSLAGMLPEDPMTMVGPVSIKFDPKNPANSIVLCEGWNGLRPGPSPRFAGLRQP